MVIFFDIDDTLIDSESAHLKAIKKLWIQHNNNPPDKQTLHKWLTITNKYLALYFEKKITLEQQRTYRIVEFWKSGNRNISEQEAYKIYQAYHDVFLNSCLVFPDTIPTLNMLTQYKLGVISNGTYSDQIFKLEHNNIIQFFEPIIISEKTGFSKPAKKIFSLAANEVQKAASDCMYIGNSHEFDYQGSLNAGMKGIWLDRKNSMTDFKGNKINSLHELTKYL